MRSFREGSGSKLFIGVLAIAVLVWGLAITALVPVSAASRHTEGSVVVSGGTVWYVGATERRGFPSAEVFLSHGYSFGQVLPAAEGDLALPAGANMTFADGTLVNDNGTVYMVNQGARRGFTSAAVFTGLGFSFANVRAGSTAGFSDGPVINSATAAHPAGTLVNSGGTIWQVRADGRAGVPSLAVFNSYGWSFGRVVAANAATMALPALSNVAARPMGGSLVQDGTQPVSGALTVSLASTNPASTVLVAGQSAADLAHFSFSGTGTVTSITFERIGVSGNDTPASVYLFDGATRITDGASVSTDNRVTFGAQNLFTVSGMKTISVRADIAASTAGQTIGMKLVSYTVHGGSANSVNLSGNIHSIAQATLAIVEISDAASLPGASTIDPGNDVLVWQDTFDVQTRAVNMTRLSLRKTGTAANNAFANFRLIVGGQQVATGGSLNSDSYVVFNLATPKNLATGTHTVRVEADVIGGSGKNFQMRLQSAADVGLIDTSFGAGVTLRKADDSAYAVASGTTGVVEINAGSVTTVKANDSASGNVTLGASNVSLGKWTIKANGEDIKVETLTARASRTGGTAWTNLRNGMLKINGQQFGTTQTLTANTDATFTVNYTINAGTTATVELFADIKEASGTAVDASSNITASLRQGSSNGQRLQSLAANIAVPEANRDANALTVAVGSMSMAMDASYFSAQDIVVPATNYKIADYNLVGSSTEAINVHTIAADFTEDGTFTAAKLKQVYIKYGNNQTSPRASVSASDNSWAVSFTLGVNETMPIEIYANVENSVTAGDTMKAVTTITGTTAGSNVSKNTGAVDGQTVTARAGAIVATLSADSPVDRIVHANQTIDGAKFDFAASAEAYTITEVVVGVAAVDGSVSSVTLSGGGTSVTKPGATSVTFNNLNIAVPAGQTVTLTVQLTLNASLPAGASGANNTVTLTSAKAKPASTGVEGAVTGSNIAGGVIRTYKAIPTVSATSSNGVLVPGEATLLNFSVQSTGGTTEWAKMRFSVTTSNGPTVASMKLFADGVQVTGTFSPATVPANDTTLVHFVPNVAQAVGVGVPRNYQLTGEVGGTTSAGHSIQTRIANPTAAHAANATAFRVNTASSLRYLDADGGSTVTAGDVRRQATVTVAAAGNNTTVISSPANNVRQAYGLTAAADNGKTLIVNTDGDNNLTAYTGTLITDGWAAQAKAAVDGGGANVNVGGAAADVRSIVITKSGKQIIINVTGAAAQGSTTVTFTVTDNGYALGSLVAANNSDLGLALTGGVASTASVVWSDMSASSHSATTTDWITDFLVKTLPSGLRTLAP